MKNLSNPQAIEAKKRPLWIATVLWVVFSTIVYLYQFNDVIPEVLKLFVSD